MWLPPVHLATVIKGRSYNFLLTEKIQRTGFKILSFAPLDNEQGVLIIDLDAKSDEHNRVEVRVSYKEAFTISNYVLNQKITDILSTKETETND